MKPASIKSRLRGMTVVELVLATLLASVLMVALMQLLDVTLRLWNRGETRRATIEQATGVARLLAEDLRNLHNGAQGELVAEWVTFDLDNDGVRERSWPRIRLVRQVSAAHAARLATFASDSASTAEGSEATEGTGANATTQGLESSGDAELAASLNSTPSLVEVCWVVMPISKESEERAEGRLLRGERRVDAEGRSFMDRAFFDSMQSPPAGALDEVTSGVLWMGMAFATRTTLTHELWEIGDQPIDGSGSWDAWSRERPDPLLHAWNVAAVGMPKAQGQPVLPRRVRIELEFEGERERERRTRTVDALDPTLTSFTVRNGDHLPREETSHILIDREWMELIDVQGDRVRVRRGVRATDPVAHSPGAMVHHGARVVTEIPVSAYTEVWDR